MIRKHRLKELDMEKVKLIISFIISDSFSQSDSAINDDFKSIEKIADSLFKNKNFMEATNYYEKLVKAMPNDFDYTALNMQVPMVCMLSHYQDYNKVKHIRQMIKIFEIHLILKTMI